LLHLEFFKQFLAFHIECLEFAAPCPIVCFELLIHLLLLAGHVLSVFGVGFEQHAFLEVLAAVLVVLPEKFGVDVLALVLVLQHGGLEGLEGLMELCDGLR
jgi:hypothetical protein